MARSAFPSSLKILAAVAVLFFHASLRAQTLGGGESPDISIWRILLALLVCLLVAALAIWVVYNRNMTGGKQVLSGWLKPLFRVGDAGNSGEIEILEMRKLNTQTDLCLFRYRSHEYLVLLGGQQPEILEKNPIPGRADDVA